MKALQTRKQLWESNVDLLLNITEARYLTEPIRSTACNTQDHEACNKSTILYGKLTDCKCECHNAK